MPDIVVTATRDKDSKPCQALIGNTNKTKGILPNYVTGNENWNDIKMVQAYRNLYQSSNDEYSAVTGFAGQAVLTGVGIVCGFFAPCSAARVSIPLALGSFAGQYSLSELKDSTAASVRALDARIQQLNAGC